MSKSMTMTQNDRLSVTSWGLSGDDFKIAPSVPHREFLPYVNRKQCSTVYRREVGDHEICAGGEENVDPCLESSGSPLLRHYNGMVFVEGIVVRGPTPCGKKNVPVMFTHVPFFIDWIYDQMNL